MQIKCAFCCHCRRQIFHLIKEFINVQQDTGHTQGEVMGSILVLNVKAYFYALGVFLLFVCFKHQLMAYIYTMSPELFTIKSRSAAPVILSAKASRPQISCGTAFTQTTLFRQIKQFVTEWIIWSVGRVQESAHKRTNRQMDSSICKVALNEE